MTVYLIDGEERLLVDEAVRKLKEESLPKQARDFNFDSFNGKEAVMSKVIGAAQMLPAFAPRRVVMVENADKVIDKIAEDDAALLLAYLQKPSPTTVLIFVGEKFDARSKIFKAFQKSGTVIRHSKPKPREMPDLI